MPRTTKAIFFDEQGICSLCAGNVQKSQAVTYQQDSLDRVIALIRERSAQGPFDCLVGVSGGRDSVYLLYLLTQEHKLRCLVAYYRTPFTPAVIDETLRKITTQLRVPLVEMKELSHEFHKSVAVDFVKHWKEKNDPIFANLACAPCKLLHRELFSIARHHGIPTVVHGDNKYEHAFIAAGQFRSGAKHRYSLSTNLLRLFLITGRGIALLYRHPFVLRHLSLLFKSSVLYLNPYTVYLRLRYPDIHVFNYFDYADWNEDECCRALKSVGWQLPMGLYSAKKADCTFAHIKNLMFARSAGADYFDCLFSNMVRYGVVDRTQALERLKKEGCIPQDCIDNTYRILGLPDDYLGHWENGR